MSDSVGGRATTRALIAGFGSIGRRHFHNLRALGCNEFVFYRTFQSTIDDGEIAQWPSESDLDRALAHRPSMAVICNPTSKHLEVALAAARAGCDLYIEKPLSHSMAGCGELAEIVRVSQLTTMIGCQFRFHPLLVSLRKQLSEKRIGKVSSARAEWGEYLPDWHPWENHRLSYSARPELGGGVILTLIHPLDYLYWLFGPAQDVRASVRDVPSLQTDVCDDYADITLTMAEGVVAEVHLDYIQKPPVHRLSVGGDQGRASVDFHAGTLTWEPSDGGSHVEQVPQGFERNTMFVAAMSHFLDSVKSHQPPAIPLSDGLEVLKIALQAKQCALAEGCRG